MALTLSPFAPRKGVLSRSERRQSCGSQSKVSAIGQAARATFRLTLSGGLYARSKKRVNWALAAVLNGGLQKHGGSDEKSCVRGCLLAWEANSKLRRLFGDGFSAERLAGLRVTAFCRFRPDRILNDPHTLELRIWTSVWIFRR